MALLVHKHCSQPFLPLGLNPLYDKRGDTNTVLLPLLQPPAPIPAVLHASAAVSEPKAPSPDSDWAPASLLPLGDGV